MQVDQEEYTTVYLHQNIRILRKELQMSQEELASRIGLNRGNIASYENGSAEPKICNLLKLSKLFKVSVFDLTNQDLSHQSALVRSRIAFEHDQGKKPRKDFMVEEIEEQAQELDDLIRSVRTCCIFHRNSLNGEGEGLSTFMVHFEQLHDAAKTLLCNHKALIQLIKGEKKD